MSQQADILYIQPYDKATLEGIPRRKKMYLSRAQFEVGMQIPDKYSLNTLDLNVALAKNGALLQIIKDAATNDPSMVFLSFPTIPQGNHIYQIIRIIRYFSPHVPVILGGGAISLVHDAPLRWWPQLRITACYNGFGREIPQIIAACQTKIRPEIPGVYWQPGSQQTRGDTIMLDHYSPPEFYSSLGRRNFGSYLRSIRDAGLKPLGILEMTRGCTNKCTFCAINHTFGCYTRAPRTVADEAEFLVGHGINHFHIIDPTFGIKKRVSQQLLGLLAELHQQHPSVRFEMLTRAELVTEEMARGLAKAGVARCAIGMESLSTQRLQETRKQVSSRYVRQAATLLSQYGIEVKLFHMLFPNCMSEETTYFLLQLSKAKIPFIMQSSFLRPLPDCMSAPDFLSQDRTIYSDSDSIEQLMEYMLANCAFNSMDMGNADDAELQAMIQSCAGKHSF